MPPMLARVLLVLVSAAAVAWLAIWLDRYDAYQHARSEAIAKGATRDPARVRHVANLFESARDLTPDTLPMLGEALFLTQAGDNQRATRVLNEVLRREPGNVSAWGLLAQADPARAAEARARVGRLNPFALRP
jgi:predicted Zn-dependent protease